MSSDVDFVRFVCEQAGLDDRLTYRKMFGEYAVYLDGKVVALVCDNQLFVKPTVRGRALLREPDEQRPFPEAKLYFRLSAELDDRELLQRVLVATAQEVPEPKLRVPRKKAAAKKARPA